jgi:hypothetical protein
MALNSTSPQIIEEVPDLISLSVFSASASSAVFPITYDFICAIWGVTLTHIL